MPKPPISNSYHTLVRKINRELADLEALFKDRTTRTAWNIGRYIHIHLLEHKDRVDYGKSFYPKLAHDTHRDISTLQRAVQFYRAYPISVTSRKLTLEHYNALMTIQDKNARDKMEQKVIKNNWTIKELRKQLKVNRELSHDSSDPPRISSQLTSSIPQLSVTRGRLYTYQIVPANKPLTKVAPLVLDLGFRLQHILPSDIRVKEKDLVELTFQNGVVVDFHKSDAVKNELFTYEAHIEKVIDGDTLLASFYFQGRFLIAQKLRLRGIDAPEMDTPEGKKAKRFVESRLKDCEFVIVKTYKDRTDRFDRYLADIFYAPRVADGARIAREGIYLNQEILNEQLAVLYK